MQIYKCIASLDNCMLPIIPEMYGFHSGDETVIYVGGLFAILGSCSCILLEVIAKPFFSKQD